MKRTWVDYTERFSVGSMTFWVHRPIGTDIWHDASDYAPPLPKPVAGKGFAVYHAEFDGFVFEFRSIHELRHCIEILGQRMLPNTRALSAGTGLGPNCHWLSRLPGHVKPWRYRERAVAYLQSFLQELEKDR